MLDDGHNVAIGWLVDLSFAVLYMIIASVITMYVGPGAMGSGVAEAMGMLNGVKYPNFIGIRTFLVKTIGIIFVVSSGLCGGKEGPLVHIGVSVAILTIYLPIPIFKYFRNDTEKRKFIAIGAAAGVSAAFGAPIGGSLFAYEISKPSPFWSFSLTWKVFFASSISCFFLEIF